MAKAQNTVLVGENVHISARRCATKGHRDWIVWRGKDGLKYAAPCSADALKAAMLATGTQGRFIRYFGSGGFPMSGSWSVAAIWWKNAKAGY